jgi:hypothetical protein
MSAQELTNAIASHNQKRLLAKGKSRKPLPKRCAFHTMCGQKPTRWAWHTYLLKLLAVCEHCFETNEHLKEPKAKKN